jgi:hypothetical protein
MDPYPGRVTALQQAGIPVTRIFAGGGSNAKFRPGIVPPIAFGLSAVLILFFLLRGHRLIASGLRSAYSVEGRRLALIGVFGRDPIR